MVEPSVGPYLILEQLGSGGMGDVYLAEDPRLKRKVALKSLSDSWLRTPGAREFLLREARAAATLNHPGIAAIYDIVESGDRAHIVMEYVQGEPLSRRLARGPLTPDQVTDIAIQLCDAMTAAHARGVIHRDLKPANVVLTADGQVKVLDFGLAKTIPAAEHEDTLATMDSTPASGGERMLGTPAYMAPEQLRRQTVDHRTDIYSLGVLLYELLTLVRPFRGTGIVELGMAILSEPTPVAAQANPAIPSGLSGVVARAMARDPDERFQSAAAMSEALRRLPRGISDQPTLSAFVDPAQLWVRRPLKRLVLVILPFAVLGTLFTVLGSPRGARPSAGFAERDWLLIADVQNATGEPVFDESLREGLTVALSQSAYVNVFPRQRVRDALARMKREPTSPIDAALGSEICRREGVKVLLVGSIRKSGAAFQMGVQALEPRSGRVLLGESQGFTTKEEVFDRVDALARRVRESLGESVTQIEETSRPLAKVTTRSLEALELYSKAREAWVRGDVASAATLLRRALDLDPSFALAHLHLAHAATVLGEPAGAREHYDAAYRLRSEATDRERYLIEASHHKLDNDYVKVVETLKVLASLYPDDLDAHEELALAYYDATGDTGNAISELREVLRLDPYDSQAYGNLGIFLVRNNEFDKAIDLYEDAGRKGLASPYFGWGLGLARLGRDEVAAATAEFVRLERAGPPYQALGRLLLARTAVHQGRLASAAETLATGIESDRDQKDEPAATQKRLLRARIRWVQGQRAAARRDLDLALDAGAGALSAEPLRDAGQLRAEMGELKGARAILARLKADGGAQPSPFHWSCVRNLEGQIALAEHRPDEAARQFLAAGSNSPRYRSQMGLARAYEAQREWSRAVQAWQRVIEARGEVLRSGFPADWPMAHFELGRMRERMGDRDGARAAYQEFLRLWRDADPLPVREEASRSLRRVSVEAPVPVAALGPATDKQKESR